MEKTGAKQKKRTRQERKLYDIIKLEGENEKQLRDPVKEPRSFLLPRKTNINSEFRIQIPDLREQTYFC